MKKTQKKQAFTLAEVLITLGIIGVVAAMTIPTMVKNYQKAVWINRLKQSYATLQQGFKRMLADDGVDLLSQTEVFQTLSNPNHCSDLDINNPNNSAICKNFSIQLRKYFKILDSKTSWRYPFPALYKTHWLNGNEAYNICSITTLADGTTWINHGGTHYSDTVFKANPNVTFYPFTTNGTDVIAEIAIDVNGIKRPNTYGLDIFVFWVRDNGIVIPGRRLNNSFKCDKTGDGGFCSERVIKEGWKINYY